MQKIFLLISFLLLISCQITGKKSYSTPGGFQAPEPFLEEKGVEKPVISSNGKKLLYIKEVKNNNKQIFIKNLEDGGTRQITHQVGDITEIGFYPGENKIIYASTTDEDKENPKFLKSQLYPNENFENELNTEIYLSNLYGGDIVRLTRHEGFDGYFDVHPLSALFVYTEKTITNLRIKKGKNQNYKVYKSSEANEKYPRFSPNGNHLVWLTEKDQKYELQIISDYQNKKNKRSIPLEDLTYVQSMAFHPQSEWLLFSAISNKTNSDKEDIYAFNIITECRLRLSFYPGLDLDPIFHPDGNSWFFVSDRDGKKQIFRSYYWPVNLCHREGKS